MIQTRDSTGTNNLHITRGKDGAKKKFVLYIFVLFRVLEFMEIKSNDLSSSLTFSSCFNLKVEYD
jgi:hypothetical protein